MKEDKLKITPGLVLVLMVAGSWALFIALILLFIHLIEIVL